MSAASRPVRSTGTPHWPGAGARRGVWRRRAGRLPLSHTVGLVSLTLATLLFCWKLVLGDLVVIGYDTMTYMYPYRHYAAAALAEGRIPLWNPAIYFGAPFLANLQSAVFYPPHVLFLLLPPTEAMNWSVVLHLFLCALFASLLARRLMGQDAVAATVAGALYGLSGFVGSQVGHLNQLNAAAWLPAALLVEHLALTAPRPAARLRWIALLALVMALQLLAGHAQETYMTAVLLALYALFFVCWRTVGAWRGARHPAPGATRAPGAPTARRAVLTVAGRDSLWAGVTLGVAGALAGGLAALQLLPTNELTGLSIRAGGMTIAEASSFSLPPRQLFVGLLPTFGLAAPTSNEYLGWIGFGGLTLALIGVLFRLRRPPTLFFLLLALVSFLLALGNHTPLFQYTFQVPGMSLFRVPARWLLLSSLSLAMLGGEGLAALRQLGRHEWPQAGPYQRLGAATRLLAGVLLVGLLTAVLWPLQRAGAEALPGTLVALWLGLAAGAIVLAFVALAGAPGTWPAHVFAAWVFVELFAASRSLEYNNPNPTSVYTASRPVIEALRDAQGPELRLLSTAATGYHPSDADRLVAPYRDVLGERGVMATLVNTKYKEIISPNLSMVFGLPTVDGYDGGVLPLRRYLTFKRVVVAPEQNLPDSLLRDQLRPLPPAPRLRQLGVTHLLTDAMGDVTQDGVFYDLVGSATIAGGDTLRLTRFGSAGRSTGAGAIPVTGVGLVTALDGAAAVPDGALVATVTLGDGAGQRWRADLVAGRDTADANHTPGARHRRPQPVQPERPGAALYLARFTVDGVSGATWVQIQSHLPAAMGLLRVNGLSLTGPGGQSWPVAIGRDDLQLVHRSDVKLYRLEDSLPRAYVVHEARVADGPDGALAALTAEGHRPERVATLERDPGPPAPGASPLRERLHRLLAGVKSWLGVERDPRLGTVPDGYTPPPPPRAGAPGETIPASRVTWTATDPERMVLRVESGAPGLLVLRDTYYPGWTATVDGRPAPLLRADVLFRAVPLEAGAHTVELRYRSLAFERGLLIGAVAAGLTAILALLPVLPWWRRRASGGDAALW